jgi:hypothetical protein
LNYIRVAGHEPSDCPRNAPLRPDSRGRQGTTVVAVGRRIGIGVASGVLLLALAWPAVAPEELDSLPLSNYPMFARPREAISWFHMAVRLDADGVEHRLDLRTVGGTDQPVQAAETVRQAIRRGEADELCAEIARRLDAPGTVQVLTVAYDAPAWFRGRRDPVERRVHAECPVEDRP